MEQFYEGTNGFDTEVENLALYEDDFAYGESDFGEFEDDLALGESGFADFEDLDEITDFEGDEFFKGLWKKVRRVARRVAPILKTIAPIAGKVVGGAFGGPAGMMAGSALGSLLGNLEDEEAFGEFEDFEDGEDSEDELGATAIPWLSGDNEALAELFAAEAAEAESEAEAQSLAGGITIHLIAPAPFAIKKVAPILTKRAARLTRLLRKSPSTRPLIKAIPTIQKKTVATLAKKAAKGKPVSPKSAVRVMAKQTRRVLASPKKTATAIVKNNLKRGRINKKAVMRAERYA